MTKFTVGADISKSKINFCLFLNEKFHLEREVLNDKVNLRKFIKEVVSLSKSYQKQSKENVEIVFACEFTGIYNFILLQLVNELNINIYVIHALNIKLSMGMSREKNDRVDAITIAEYSFRFNDKLKFWIPKKETITMLKHLESQRSRLVKTRTQLTQSDDDNRKFMNDTMSKTLADLNSPIIGSINASIKIIEDKMMEILKQENDLWNNYQILVSIPGIGPVIARSLICITENFTKFDSAKKFGCYCGVVPFAKSSGYLKGKSKVSKLANKELKKLIHLGAMSVINSSNHFGIYYQRKILEGKHHMLAVNNLRNKLIITAFGCIKKGMKYSEGFSYAA